VQFISFKVITFDCSHLCRLIVKGITVELVGAVQDVDSFIVTGFGQISSASIKLWIASCLSSKPLIENLVAINVETSGNGINIGIEISDNMLCIAVGLIKSINIFVNGCINFLFIRCLFSIILLKARFFTWTNCSTRIDSWEEIQLIQCSSNHTSIRLTCDNFRAAAASAGVNKNLQSWSTDWSSAASFSVGIVTQ